MDSVSLQRPIHLPRSSGLARVEVLPRDFLEACAFVVCLDSKSRECIHGLLARIFGMEACCRFYE